MSKLKFEQCKYCASLSGSVHITTVMGKTTDFKVVQMTNMSTVHTECKLQNVIFTLWTASLLKGSSLEEKSVSGKRWTRNKGDCSLERNVKQTQFKNLGELHKEWTEAGVSAPRATTCRSLQKRSCKCCILNVKPLLRQRQCQKSVGWGEKELDCCSVVLSSF